MDLTADAAEIFIIGICSAVGVIILLASIYLYCGIDRKCSGCKRPIKWWQSRKVGTDYEDTVYHRIGCYDERMTRKWDAGRDTALRKTMREERLAEEDEAQLERERKMGFPDRV